MIDSSPPPIKSSQGVSWQLTCHGELPSTSTTLMAQAMAGAPSGTAVLALRQSAGRGSRGRVWQAPSGNLSFSFLVDFPTSSQGATPGAGEAFLAMLPFMAAVAVHQALERFWSHQAVEGGSPARLEIKWPNDIMVHQQGLPPAKLCGMLVETAHRPQAMGGGRCAVIGVGVNLRHAPEGTGRPVTTLAVWLGQESAPRPADLAWAIMEAFGALMDGWGTGKSDFVLAEWRKRAHPPGTMLAVQGTGTYITGMFHDVDAQGKLLLKDASGNLAAVMTGDVLCLA
ncbi:biotin--[acetyl-CoA-carboxylase] ligase [Formicincola oecophyllae]|uniref:Biotin--[acetyl-CoA-carboxylase] ligase n=1 Tax=Formicincola oecophyllae TaxID=2558361 RepID=A0A4Y6U6I5_9PROT|nr:biotin--[acetyl-CoA-carboxylase] ligase [Formicincola oecophyllae]QDH12963.1 biotin--[acetyl-CoA-carboxylase] ligase [Formicincola oecophyllae]